MQNYGMLFLIGAGGREATVSLNGMVSFLWKIVSIDQKCGISCAKKVVPETVLLLVYRLKPFFFSFATILFKETVSRGVNSVLCRREALCNSAETSMPVSLLYEVLGFTVNP